MYSLSGIRSKNVVYKLVSFLAKFFTKRNGFKKKWRLRIFEAIVSSCFNTLYFLATPGSTEINEMIEILKNNEVFAVVNLL